LERFFEDGGGVDVVLGGEGDGDGAAAVAGVESGAAVVSSPEEGAAWCDSAAGVWTAAGVAAADADVAVEGLPAGCAAPPFGCGESEDAEPDADAEGGCEPLAEAAPSNSAFSSSVIMLVVALVISFIRQISPICNAEDAQHQSTP